ncbi:MAG: hypothetical protein HC802_04295 [Caldilineaceae bacterium]|nr:hypothetical protein [Caldilineaceae bacterium]
MLQMTESRWRWSRGWLLLLVVMVAIILRFWQINSLPPGFHDDESFEGLEALRILNNPEYRPIFLTGSSGVPPANIYANVVMFRLFQLFGGEPGPLAMRVTAALFGVLSVAVLFGLGREMTFQAQARARLSAAFPLFAAAALTILRWHVHFSRIGIEPILVPLLWAMALWLLFRGWRTGDWISFAASGVAAAATIYTYQAAWIIPLILVLVTLHLMIRDRVWRRPQGAAPLETDGVLQTRRLRGVLLAAMTGFILLTPLLLFFWDNWDLLAARPDQVLVVAKGGRSAAARILDNGWSMVKMFGPLGAPGDDNLRRNIPGAAVLDFWLAIPFYLGLLVAVWRFRFPVYAAVLLSLVGLALPGVVSTSAPISIAAWA